MSDIYDEHMTGLDSPAIGGFAFTASDATVFDQPTRAVWVGTGGDVAVVMVDGTSVTIPSVPSGYMLPVRATKVKATGTTASGLVGLY